MKLDDTLLFIAGSSLIGAGVYAGLRATGVVAPNPREETLTLDGTKTGFVTATMAALQRSRPSTSVATRLLVTAHGAYESDWGKCTAAKEGNNLWNLTAGSAWNGPVVLGGDTEYTVGSADAKKITQRFRKYGSLEEAINNYWMFLSSSRYRDGLSKLEAGDMTFVRDLGAYTYAADGRTVVPAWPKNVVKGGFYTLPIPKYVAGFNARLAEVQKLAQVTAF